MRLDEVEERRERILLARKASSQEDYDKAQAQKLKSAAKVEADRASLEQTVADFKIDIDTMPKPSSPGPRPPSTTL